MVQGGWSPQQFADAPGGFTLEELDGAAPRNPLFVQQGYSIVYANSLALRAVGLDPKDGAQRNAAGLATFQPPYGAFIERIPPTTPEQFERNLDRLHAHAEQRRAHGRLQLGPRARGRVGAHRGARR